MQITISEEGPKSVEESISIPASDMRKLGAVTRLAQMNARANQRNYVTPEDAEEACILIDLSLAEAGAWRLGADKETREYQTDPIASYHYKIAEERAIRERALFTKIVEKLSFETCYECRGTGEVTEIGGQAETCENCNGAGKLSTPFSKNDMITEIVGQGINRLQLKIFNSIWAEREKVNLLIPHDDYGRWRNFSSIHWSNNI